MDRLSKTRFGQSLAETRAEIIDRSRIPGTAQCSEQSAVPVMLYCASMARSIEFQMSESTLVRLASNCAVCCIIL